MYTAFFSLNEVPFSIAPNPRFLFMSDRHREALSHLTYGLGDTGGFVLLTGEVGTGKTTISRCLMEQLPDNIQIAFILNPTLSSQELLATICDELKIKYRKTGATLKTLTDKIQEKLLKNHANNINTLLIIDEAQHLQPEVLEQLRLLTNLETDTKKLLQVILIGQPELQLLLKRRDLRQLAQRITARYHLLPLNKQEVAQYIKHRLSIAECHRALFNDSAIATIHQLSQGIPRLINLLCDKALMQAYNTNNAVVDKKCVITASKEALGDDLELPPWWQKTSIKLIAAVAVCFAIFASGIFSANSLLSQNPSEIVAQSNAMPNGVTEQTVNNQQPVNQLTLNQAKNSKDTITSNGVSTSDVPVKGVIEQGINGDVNKAVDNNSTSVSTSIESETQTQENTSQANATDPAEQAKVVVKTEKPIAEIEAETAVEPVDISEGKQSKKEVLKEPITSLDSVEGVSDDLLAKFNLALKDMEDSGDIDYNTDESDSNAGNVRHLTDMPQWVQKGVPQLNFDMHIYASDGEGWIRVNGRDRYEGDRITDDLFLEQILPQKVILSYQGQRFSLPALSSW